MARGRPVDPTRARRKTGNRPMPGQGKKSPTQVLPVGTLERAPRDEDGLPAAFTPPEDLPTDVARIWRGVSVELYPRGLRPADMEAVRQMCYAAYRARQAGALIDKHGVLVAGKAGPIPNPMLKIEKDATATYLRLADAMGLTIAARLRLGLLQVMGESIVHALNRDLDLDG